MTVIALIIEGSRHYFFEGKVEGEIIRQPRELRALVTTLFFYPREQKQTFAEMSLNTKMAPATDAKRPTPWPKFPQEAVKDGTRFTYQPEAVRASRR